MPTTKMLAVVADAEQVARDLLGVGPVLHLGSGNRGDTAAQRRRHRADAIERWVIIAPVGVGEVETDHGRAVGVCSEQALVRSCDELVERQQQVRLALAQPVGGGRAATAGQAHVAHHRARLLRQADLVESPHVEAVEHAPRCPASGLTVTTPVPPMPVMRSASPRQVRPAPDREDRSVARRGVACACCATAVAARPPALRSHRPRRPAGVLAGSVVTVMNDGQSPSRHE